VSVVAVTLSNNGSGLSVGSSRQ